MGWKLRARPPRRFACFSHRWRDAVSSPDSTARFLAFSMVLERFSLRALAASASFSAAVGSFGLPEQKRTEQADRSRATRTEQVQANLAVAARTDGAVVTPNFICFAVRKFYST